MKNNQFQVIKVRIKVVVIVVHKKIPMKNNSSIIIIIIHYTQFIIIRSDIINVKDIRDALGKNDKNFGGKKFEKF